MDESTYQDVKMDQEPRARDPSPARTGPSVAIETQSQKDRSLGVVRDMRTDPEMAKDAFNAIRSALNATVSVWDAASKSFIDRPDYKTRLMGATLYLSHAVGLPVQRSENLNINAESAPQVPYEEMLKRSPALREAAKRAIARAEEKGD